MPLRSKSNFRPAHYPAALFCLKKCQKSVNFSGKRYQNLWSLLVFLNESIHTSSACQGTNVSLSLPAPSVSLLVPSPILKGFFLSLFTGLPPSPPSHLLPASRAVQQAPRWLSHGFLPPSSAAPSPPLKLGFAERRCPRGSSRGAHAPGARPFLPPWRGQPGQPLPSHHGTGGRRARAGGEGRGAAAEAGGKRPGKDGPAASELPPGALPPASVGS